MNTHNSPVSSKEPDRHKPASRATGRQAAVSRGRRPATETPLAHHAIEKRSHDDGVPSFAETMRWVIRSLSAGPWALTLKHGDRVFSLSASERGEDVR